MGGGSSKKCDFTFSVFPPENGQPGGGPGAAFSAMANDRSSGFASAGGLDGGLGDPLPGGSLGGLGSFLSGPGAAIGAAGDAAKGITHGVEHLFGGGGNTTAEDLKILNCVVANTVVNAITQCQDSTNVDQRQVYQCVGTQLPGAPYPLEENPSCGLAGNLETNFIQNRLNLEAAAGNPLSTDDLIPTGAAADYQNAIANGGVLDYTLFACRSCVFANIEQDTNVHVTLTCASDTKVQNTVKNSMNASIQQMLSNKEDFLGQLGGILGQGNKDCVGSDLANKLTDKVDDSFISSLITTMNTAQFITFAGDTNRSIYASGFSQSLNANSVASLVSNTNVTNSLYNSDQVNSAQSLYHSNDTIGDLANALSRALTGSAQIFSSIITQLLFVVAGICGVLLLAFGFVALSDRKKAGDLLDTGASALSNRLSGGER